MKIGKLVFATMFAIGLGSSCAYAQTASTSAQIAPSSALTTSATTTLTAVVAQVNRAAGTISLTQTLPTKPKAVHDSPTATADYRANPVLLNIATVGATVQATVVWINGTPAVIALNGVSAMPQVVPAATAGWTLAIPNPSRLTPSGAP